MKNAVIMLTGTILLTLTLMMLMAIYGRMNYSMELQSNLSSVMEEQISEMMSGSEYERANVQEFLADFMQNFIMALDGKYNLKIDILQLDMEKGILGVRATAEFQYLNGDVGTVSCERVVIFEQ